MTTPRPVDASFVMEVHLGHRTYRDNLAAVAGDVPGIRATFHDVRYEDAGALGALPLPDRAIGPLAGRHEVRRALRSPADVRVFNTQVPAALAGRRRRDRPYVVVTDITPTQYDAMAEIYEHDVSGSQVVARWKHHVNVGVFRGARTCVGWSNWTTASIVQDYGVSRERTAVIPPGVDLDRWTPGRGGDTGMRILFVGGDFERKGGPDLLDAFEALPDTAELVLVTRSDVPATDRVRVVRDLGPNDPRLLELYRSSDVFALPSRGEAFGIAGVEASASGLPVVATAVGGLRDVVADGESGLVVDAGDGTALGRALRRLHDDTALRRRLGAGARRRAEERFDARSNARRLLDIVRAAAEDTPPHAR